MSVPAPDTASPGSAERAGALRRLGLMHEPEILAATATPLDRGHHLAVVAAEGSGKEALIGVAVATRCERDATGVQALVLSPTREAALRAARAVNEMGAHEGITGLAASAGERPAGATGESFPMAGDPTPTCVTGPPEALLAEVRGGRLGLEPLRLLVIDGAAALIELEQWPAVEALVDTLPAEVQRILITDRVEEPIRDLLMRQLPRARRWPEELFDEGVADPAAETGGVLLVGAGAGAESRLDLLEAAVLRFGKEGTVRSREPEAAPTIHVICVDPAVAERLPGALRARGIPVGHAGGRGAQADDLAAVAGAVTVETLAAASGADRGGPEPNEAAGEVGPAAAAAVLFGTPPGLASLRAALGPARRRAIVVESAHLRQVEILARRAGWRGRALAEPLEAGVFDAIAAFRHGIRTQVEREAAGADLLVLEPLFAAFGATRVAAGLSSLLRRQQAARGEPRPWPDVEEASGAPGRGVGGAPARPLGTAAAGPPGRDARVPGGTPRAPGGRSVRPAWTRIYIGAGRRDEVRPADLVGAITGETDVVGGQIGKIEIRQNFSLVDIDSQVVDEVIRHMDGTSIRGRTAAVRLDREA